MARHQDLTANHILESFTYNTIGGRVAATGFVAGDLGRIAYDSFARQDASTHTAYWRLTAITPVWAQVSPITNFSTAAQSPAAATRTYVTGSQIAIGKLAIGSVLRWHFNMTKTAAGTAASTFDIAFGTAGTTADTAQVSFTKPAGTAVVDEGFVEIEAIVRGPLSASGIVAGEFKLIHNLSATGHATIPCVLVNTISAAFNVTTPTYVGVCITSGAADAITIQQCTAEAWNMA
jgi:hypothetical protein